MPCLRIPLHRFPIRLHSRAINTGVSYHPPAGLDAPALLSASRGFVPHACGWLPQFQLQVVPPGLLERLLHRRLHGHRVHHDPVPARASFIIAGSKAVQGRSGRM